MSTLINGLIAGWAGGEALAAGDFAQQERGFRQTLPLGPAGLRGQRRGVSIYGPCDRGHGTIQPRRILVTEDDSKRADYLYRALAPTQLRLADLELDLLSRKASRAGERLLLSAKEFALLSLLLRGHGQVLSRSQLAAQVWDMHFDADTNVVEVAVRRLRAKLDDPFEHKLLHTIRGMGYVLEERR